MILTNQTSLAFFNFSGWELAIILVLGLLIFGRRLPELGRSVGKTIVEFKKGLADVQTDVHQTTSTQPPQGGPASAAPTLPPGSAGSSTHQSTSQSQYQKPS
ncbi:MAG: twin-arginine translocase TatA/TatE family subunit [Phycisphaerales bacterium]|nr:twin-arginine translocase TatA/TatE family subunit [Phycisphaerales bacterium]